MAVQDAFKAAEARGYSKGYAAGKRAKAKAVASDRRLQQQRAFRQRAFLVMFPWVFQQDGWGKPGADGKVVPYRSLHERVGFAWNIAEEALVEGVKRGTV